MSKAIQIFEKNPGQSTLDGNFLRYDWWEKSFTVDPDDIDQCFKILKDSFLKLSVLYLDTNCVNSLHERKKDLIQHGLTTEHISDLRGLINIWDGLPRTDLPRTEPLIGNLRKKDDKDSRSPNSSPAASLLFGNNEDETKSQVYQVSRVNRVLCDPDSETESEVTLYTSYLTKIQIFLNI